MTGSHTCEQLASLGFRFCVHTEELGTGLTRSLAVTLTVQANINNTDLSAACRYEGTFDAKFVYYLMSICVVQIYVAKQH